MSDKLGCIPEDKDAFGKAIIDYLKKGWADNIIVHSSLFDPDVLDVDYLFRTYSAMPELEQKALDLCKGKVLDAGAGAGPHSLYLKNKGLDVYPIDTSALAVKGMKMQGLENAQTCNFFGYEGTGFDTVLMMMNGIGIAQSLNNLDFFFSKLKKILKPTGQLILDSSDLRYLYEDDPDACSCKYFGEIDFKMQYHTTETDIFHWLYVDFDTLKEYAGDNGFKVEKIADGSHYDFLARLTFE